MPLLLLSCFVHRGKWLKTGCIEGVAFFAEGSHGLLRVQRDRVTGKPRAESSSASVKKPPRAPLVISCPGLELVGSTRKVRALFETRTK